MAPFARSVSYKGVVLAGRPAGRSSNGNAIAYSFWYSSRALAQVYA